MNFRLLGDDSRSRSPHDVPESEGVCCRDFFLEAPDKEVRFSVRCSSNVGDISSSSSLDSLFRSSFLVLLIFGVDTISFPVFCLFDVVFNGVPVPRRLVVSMEALEVEVPWVTCIDPSTKLETDMSVFGTVSVSLST